MKENEGDSVTGGHREEALAQIDQRGYAEKYRLDGHSLPTSSVHTSKLLNSLKKLPNSLEEL